MYGLQMPGGKAQTKLRMKLRKDNHSVFSAFYFDSPAMWQEGSGPTITEGLTNAVSILDGQVPINPGCSASPSHSGDCGLQCLSFLPQTAGLVPPTEVLRT